MSYSRAVSCFVAFQYFVCYVLVHPLPFFMRCFHNASIGSFTSSFHAFSNAIQSFLCNWLLFRNSRFLSPSVQSFNSQLAWVFFFAVLYSLKIKKRIKTKKLVVGDTLQNNPACWSQPTNIHNGSWKAEEASQCTNLILSKQYKAILSMPYKLFRCRHFSAIHKPTHCIHSE